MYAFDTLPVHLQPEPLESLTSYLPRLVEANGLRLMCQLFTLCFPGERAKLTAHTGDFPPTSWGDLPTLTQCSEARLLTTTFYEVGKKFERILQPRSLAIFLSGSIAPHLRYCPQCLADHGYYSLVWRFLEVKGCPEHGCQLLERCGHCGQAIPLLTNPSRWGVCPGCGKQLSASEPEKLDERQRQTVQVCFDDFTYLISPQTYALKGERLTKRIGQQFSYWRQVRQLKVSDAARSLELHPAIIYHMEQAPEYRGANFQWYVRYAHYLQIRLRDIFETTTPCPPRPTYEEKLSHEIQQVMTSLEQQGQPITQTAIQHMLGKGNHIFSHHPHLKAMWLERWMRQRCQQREALSEAVRQAIECLQQQGKPVSRKKVSEMVGLAEVNLKKYPEAWAIVERQSDYPASIASSDHGQVRPRLQQEGELLNRVHTAIASLRAQGQPINQQAISQVVGLSVAALWYYPQVKTILQQHKTRPIRQDEEILMNKVQVALARLEATGAEVTKVAISAEAGLSIHTLEYYPRVRTLLFEEVTAKSQLHRLKQFQQREEKLVGKVQQAMTALTIRKKRVTQKAICEIVQMSSVSLKRYPRVRALLEQYGLTNRRE